MAEQLYQNLDERRKHFLDWVLIRNGFLIQEECAKMIVVNPNKDELEIYDLVMASRRPKPIQANQVMNLPFNSQ